MGKASRWIRNLLLGKKEDRSNDKDGGGATTSPPCTTTMVLSSNPWTAAFIPATPRRRWSFRRSNNTEKVVNHKSCRSFDSIIASRLVSEALFDYAIEQKSHTNMLVVPPPRPATKTADIVSRVAAATKIQAAFRSYLSRKALCALRGLVKLQALVQGHLVRKRTIAMVRCMKALVAIQVRARFQRIQMVEDAELRSHLSATSKRGLVIAHGHGRCLSAPQCGDSEKIEQFGSSKTSTSVSYRQSSRRLTTDSLPLTREQSLRLQNKPIDAVSTASETSSQHHEPNYTTRTKSSRAKARSQSEPRQRPSKQKRENRRTSSNTGLGVVTKGFRNQTHDHQMDHEGWLTKLRRSSKSINDFEVDSASSCTNGSSCRTALYTCERAANLY